MTDRPKHRPVSEAFRRQQAERDAVLEGVSQAARWAVPVEAARREAGHAGFPMSGDHRPRGGFTDEHLVPCLVCGGMIRLAKEAPHLEERRRAAIEEHAARHGRMRP